MTAEAISGAIDGAVFIGVWALIIFGIRGLFRNAKNRNNQ